jgi:hypothetical protein
MPRHARVSPGGVEPVPRKLRLDYEHGRNLEADVNQEGMRAEVFKRYSLAFDQILSRQIDSTKRWPADDFGSMRKGSRHISPPVRFFLGDHYARRPVGAPEFEESVPNASLNFLSASSRFRSNSDPAQLPFCRTKDTLDSTSRLLLERSKRQNLWSGCFKYSATRYSPGNRLPVTDLNASVTIRYNASNRARYTPIEARKSYRT